MYKAPKAIITHPAVAECTSGEQGGSDYKHDVFLKDGWVFKNGRTAGCRSLLCNSVEDFKYAEPVQVTQSNNDKAALANEIKSVLAQTKGNVSNVIANVSLSFGKVEIEAKRVLRTSGSWGSNGETYALQFKLDGKRIARGALEKMAKQ
jgi:hypothetical protein